VNAIVDSDVMSYIFKRDSRAAFYKRRLTSYSAVLTFMIVAELDFWVLRRRWGPAMVVRLDQFISTFTIVPPNCGLCRLWANVTNVCRQAGRPILPPDAWIAATALRLNAPLFTHNRSDFAAVPNLTIISATP
jgi:predicted nucleic acid-binding protein